MMMKDKIQKIKGIITKIIPPYSVPILIIVPIVNWITYFGTRFFTTNLPHYSMKIALDDSIQLFTPYIYIYVLAYIQWVIGFIIIARESKVHCYRFLVGEMIAKLLCLICFIVYPTTITRPEVTGNSLSALLTSYIYQVDAADNLFPSIHCLESYICFRGAIGLEKTPKWYLPITFVFSALVFASTVYLKQHVVMDMFGAVIVAEIGLFISKLILKKVRG